MNCIDRDRHIGFVKSIIEGVEIKRCRNVPHAHKSHVHNELSLGYITEGSTELAFEERTLIYGTGDGVVIPPLTTHRCAPMDIDHWSYTMLYVDPSYYKDEVCFVRAKRLTGTQAQGLKGFIDQLLMEEAPDTLENVLIDLLLEFGEREEAETASPNADSVVEAIHGHILANLHDDVSLDKLQEISGLNKFTIIRKFKKRYMTTPAAYHLQCRVAEAKRLLGNGVDVFDVCGGLGFYDQSHLIREFKRMHGVTPSAYLEQLKR